MWGLDDWELEFPSAWSPQRFHWVAAITTNRHSSLIASIPDRVSGYWLRLHRPQFDFENVRGVGLDVLSDRRFQGSPSQMGRKPQAEAARVGEIQ